MKAILVIDYVDCCGRCPMLDRSFPHSCLYTGKVIHVNSLCSHREKDCPLKPIPQKYGIDMDEKFAQGYNKCIDELLGETE